MAPSSSPPPTSLVIRSLKVKDVFGRLTEKEKLYAHHMSRAAWPGTRIILQHVSPETTHIFDLIMELHKSCHGDWTFLLDDQDDPENLEHLRCFLRYAALFLSNIGNYYGEGDRKFVPDVPKSFIDMITSTSDKAKELASACAPAMLSPDPPILAFPGPNGQSQYYPGSGNITTEEVKTVGKIMEQHSIASENTRIRKMTSTRRGSKTTRFEVLQASIERDPAPVKLSEDDNMEVWLVRGDYSEYLLRVKGHLSEACEATNNEVQKLAMNDAIRFLETGSIEKYKDYMRKWVKNKEPSVEAVFGFVEPYRDPAGTRCEFEGIVAVKDMDGSKTFDCLIESAQDIISTLPWISEGHDDNANGPFEVAEFHAPSFSSVFILAYCSSYLFLGINLPNYSDIKETCGFKNLMTNRETPPDSQSSASQSSAPFIDETERATFLLHSAHSLKVKIALHELFGHGTGKLLTQHANGDANFNVKSPPKSPLTGKPITTWYINGRTFPEVFGKMATAIDECRCDLVGAYLALEKRVLSIFGYTDDTCITADDSNSLLIVYNMYLDFGRNGIQALAHYDAVGKTWTQPHARARHSIMRVLLAVGNGELMRLDVNKQTNHITVHLSRSHIMTLGKQAITDFLLRLHVWRSTADVEAAEAYFGTLTSVDEGWLGVRDIVLESGRDVEVFAQPNTLVEGGRVMVREYDGTVEGVVRSWAERDV
ncbi:dipeptidyl peptidase III [Lophiostoma macrostomum CBS 122681]|uniref:Dipeptidyl peptidase III n=1 Tax=Lophiostoma macrostomum CBS 122681 TaxID=1314788 RepID=A0A6A6SSR6_9PLEO|nr:dipeptidyl peptidase III [Lophiostoma macrostomum CBS 122681]